ncbi:MAG: Gfo/Idh/MocA family oxidoreductase, partial [Spirochaeta sp.]|nr:Gfo/Idh/MocA family oxidoreductase [Spirochaeta sp.]
MSAGKLRFAIIGGALDSFMGPVHRIAATLDGQADLVAGSFSRRTEKNSATAAAWHVPAEHVYTDYRELLAHEAAHLDFVVIATPNNTHVEIASAAIEAGLAVASDKPVGISSEEGRHLKAAIARHNAVYMLTHNYIGYPMVKEARAMRTAGELGKINRVVVEMPQGWVQGLIAATGEEPNLWRMDPAIVGPSLITADVGTHAAHMAEYVTGLRVTSVAADLSPLLSTSDLENDANILIRFDNGAAGIVTVSQFATGERNPFSVRVYGTRAGIEWMQETPEWLVVKEPSGNERRIHRGHAPDAESSKWSR